jgi:hypothetical protein
LLARLKPRLARHSPLGERDGLKRIVLTSSADGLDPEAFRLESALDGTIHIRAGGPRGLVYAVYDFLEKGLGVRWYAPFDFARIVPQHERLVLPAFRDEVVPASTYRRMHYCSHKGTSLERKYEVADWAVKNRFNVEMERLVNRKGLPELS